MCAVDDVVADDVVVGVVPQEYLVQAVVLQAQVLERVAVAARHEQAVRLLGRGGHVHAVAGIADRQVAHGRAVDAA